MPLLSLLLLPTLLPGAFGDYFSECEPHLNLQLLGLPKQKNLLLNSSSLSFHRLVTGDEDQIMQSISLHAEGPSLGQGNVVLRVENEMIYLRVLIDVQWSIMTGASRELWMQVLNLWTKVFQRRI
jgi:hypothetical protein